MFKKLSAALMVIVVAVSMVSLSAFAAPRKIVLERLDSDATTYVKVNATNNTADDARVNLIAVYTDENDKITAINQSGAIAVAQGATETITVEIEDMSATSTLSYYIWDGEEIRTPLENSAPVPSTELNSPDQSMTTVDLEWNAGDDDYHGITSYNVYNMGIFLGNTEDRSFTATNQERGVETTYSVKAVDDEGIESVQEIALNMMTKNIPTVILDGDNIIESGGLLFCNEKSTSYYGFSGASEADGLACRATVNPSKDGYGGRDIVTRIPFKFSAEAAAELANEPDLTFIMTYYDDDMGYSNKSITMDYNRVGDGPDSLYTGATLGSLGNTKQWKTLVKRVTNCNFGELSSSSGNSYCKLRIFASGGKGLKIYSLSVLPTSQYNELMKEAIGRVTDAYINDGVLFTDKADDTEKVKIDGKGGVKVDSGSVLECDVTESAVTGSSTVNVEVEYYTETEGEEIVFTYNYDGNEPIVVPVTATGEWQRVRFELTDADFGGNSMSASQIANADFTIGTSSGNEITIHSVRAYIPE